MLAGLSGATRVHLIIGHPIAQVKAPGGVTQAMRERGHDVVIVPIDVRPTDLDGFLAGLTPVRNIDGVIVTIPHKFSVVPHCTTMSDRVRLLSSCNIMRRNADGTWHGDMFDGMGFVGGIRNAGCKPEGKRALLIGAGGAGSAIGLALLDSGVQHLAVHDADTTRRDRLIERLASAHAGKVGVGSSDPTGFEVIANATPSGMQPGDAYPVDPAKLHPSMFVGEVITKPEVTPLLEAARALGCGTQTGVGMFQAELDIMIDFLLGGAAADAAAT